MSIHKGAVVTDKDKRYLKRIAELEKELKEIGDQYTEEVDALVAVEKENARLKQELADKDSQLAEYHKYITARDEENASLKEQVRVRGERMELMWEVMRAHCPWPIEGGPTYMRGWFDDNGKCK